MVKTQLAQKMTTALTVDPKSYSSSKITDPYNGDRLNIYWRLEGVWAEWFDVVTKKQVSKTYSHLLSGVSNGVDDVYALVVWAITTPNRIKAGKILRVAFRLYTKRYTQEELSKWQILKDKLSQL